MAARDENAEGRNEDGAAEDDKDEEVTVYAADEETIQFYTIKKILSHLNPRETELRIK